MLNTLGRLSSGLRIVPARTATVTIPPRDHHHREDVEESPDVIVEYQPDDPVPPTQPVRLMPAEL